jgi:hypothetical protein
MKRDQALPAKWDETLQIQGTSLNATTPLHPNSHLAVRIQTHGFREQREDNLLFMKTVFGLRSVYANWQPTPSDPHSLDGWQGSRSHISLCLGHRQSIA